MSISKYLAYIMTWPAFEQIKLHDVKLESIQTSRDIEFYNWIADR